jgi:hypothetical protein
MSSSVASLILTRLLESDLIPHLVKLALQYFQESRFRGMYRVKSHHVRLELLDQMGSSALYKKNQTVEFLTDGVIAVQDQAYGDGELFAEYRCSPGVIVDRYREGYRYRVLISLRTTKNRGDVQEFHIERLIKDGFLTPVGNFQTQIDHPTNELSIAVTFPASRLPQSVHLIEQNSRRTRIVQPTEFHAVPDGRMIVRVEVGKPRLYEGYILRWEW